MFHVGGQRYCQDQDELCRLGLPVTSCKRELQSARQMVKVLDLQEEWQERMHYSFEGETVLFHYLIEGEVVLFRRNLEPNLSCYYFHLYYY